MKAFAVEGLGCCALSRRREREHVAAGAWDWPFECVCGWRVRLLCLSRWGERGARCGWVWDRAFRMRSLQEGSAVCPLPLAGEVG